MLLRQKNARRAAAAKAGFSTATGSHLLSVQWTKQFRDNPAHRKNRRLVARPSKPRAGEAESRAT